MLRPVLSKKAIMARYRKYRTFLSTCPPRVRCAPSRSRSPKARRVSKRQCPLDLQNKAPKSSIRTSMLYAVYFRVQSRTGCSSMRRAGQHNDNPTNSLRRNLGSTSMWVPQVWFIHICTRNMCHDTYPSISLLELI